MSEKGLTGKKILITRPAEKAGATAEQVAKKGGLPIILPLVDTTAISLSPSHLKELSHPENFDWIVFTSSDAVTFFWQAINIKAEELPAKIKFASVGDATTSRLRDHGIRVCFVPEKFTSAALAEEIPLTKGERVLIPTTRIADDSLKVTLENRGAVVTVIHVYDTIIASVDETTFRKAVKESDVLTFASPSAVESFIKLGGAKFLNNSKLVACIGPVTAEGAEKNGLRVDIMPEKHTSQEMIDSIEMYLSNEK